MRSLMRTQLRLGLLVVRWSCGAGWPRCRCCSAWPPAKRWGAGFAAAVAVLGLAVYPVVVAAACYYVRRVERAERDFADLVEQS